MRRTLFWVAAGAALASCGDTTSGECGAGTFLEDGQCLPVDPNDTTPPTVSVDPPLRTRVLGDVRLVSDEPAEIYYTTDGTTPTLDSAHEPSNVLLPDLPDDAVVHYFAVDRAGNQTPVVRLAWDVDALPPAPPRGFTLNLSGTTRSLSWSNPSGAADFAGTIVARVEGAAAAPAPGVRYAVGDEIAPGVTVVAVGPLEAGAAGTASESRPTSPGIVRYLAWSHDDLLNYSSTSDASALVDIPAQAAAISVDVAAGTVAIPAPPAHVGLTGSATFAAGTLTLTLAIENRTNRALFAPKVLLADLAGTAGTWSDEDGELAQVPYRAYGAAIAPGATLTRRYKFEGVGATDVLTAQARIAFNPVLAVGYWDAAAAGILDDATGTEILGLPTGGIKASGPSGREQQRPGGITVDGRLILGARTASRISVYDLTTGLLAGGVTLEDRKSSAAQVVLTNGGGTGYALLLDSHAYTSHRTGGDVSLVRFDVLTLRETARLDLGLARSRSDLRLSPDGRSLAVTGGLGEIVIVDLDTFTVKTRLAVLAGSAAWSPDGTQLAAGAMLSVRLYDTATWAVAKELPLAVAGGKVHRMGYGGDGRLWIGRQNNTVAVDTVTGTAEVFDLAARSLEIYAGKPYVTSGRSTTRLDLTGDEELEWELRADQRGHAMSRSPF